MVSLTHPFTAPDINTVLSTSISQFDERLRNVFPVSTVFEGEAYTKFTASLLSNLLGGLGYFYGDSKVDNSSSPEYEEVDMDFWEKAGQAMSRAEIATTTPTQLLSFTPSRPFFPRGFLWDEGFHLLPIIEWDLDLAVSVIQSWLELMDDNGWIEREQILGPEARSKVPEKFQVQYPHYANPPTLSLLLPIILSKVTKTSNYFGHPSQYITPSDESADLPSLDKLSPLFDRHYEWFRRTQAGNFSAKYPRPESTVSGEGYRWRGRTPTHTMTSGLDDYPRANPPHPGELHLDALAWVGASAKSLLQLAEHLGLESAAAKYSKHLEEIKRNLDVLHWDEQAAAYCDATVSSSGMYERVCHLGYISLMPFLLGLMEPEHPHLSAVLDLLSDPGKLWSPHGLRSLSLADEFYGKDENYWRGAVWMNMNVLAVQQLHALSLADGPEKSRAAKLGAELRKNVVQTVYDSWATTGFVWEQYSDKTGDGKGSRAFTGWTACIVLLTGLEFAGYEAGKGGQGAAPTPLSLGFIPAIILLLAILILVFAIVVLVLAITLHTQQFTDIWDYVKIQYRRARGREQVTYEEIIDLEDWNQRSHID